jgi:MFS family permease
MRRLRQPLRAPAAEAPPRRPPPDRGARRGLRAIRRPAPDGRPVGDARRARTALAAVLVGDIVLGAQQTALLPALPPIERHFHASAARSALLASVYLVVAAVVSPLLGKLGDARDKRLMMALALAVFMAGSAGAAFATGMWMLIGFRALQGTAGAVFPLSFAIARDELPEHRLGRGMGILTAGWGAGAGVGYVAGGLLAQVGSWRLVFALGALLLAAGTLVVWAVTPRSPVRSGRRPDRRAALLLALGLGLLLIVLGDGGELGWTSPAALACAAGGVALLAAWVRRELRHPGALVDVRTAARRPIALLNAGSACLGGATWGVYVLVPHLASASGPLDTGLLLLPIPAGLLVTGLLVARAARRVEPRRLFAGGLALAAVACGSLAAGRAGTGWVATATFVYGCGFGLVVGSIGMVIAAWVEQAGIAGANTFNGLVQLVGGAVGAQLVGVALASTTPATSAARLAFAGLAVAAGLGAAAGMLIPGALDAAAQPAPAAADDVASPCARIARR